MSRIVRYRRNRGRPRFGVLSVDGKSVHELAGDPYRAGQPKHAPEPVASLDMLAPVHPGTIVCVGLNHGSTRAVLNRQTPSHPLLFLKSRNSVTGPNGSIECPPGVDALDVAGELAVVMGRRARHVTEHQAMDHVFGFTCAIDVGVREWLATDSQWFRAKSSDTFCPLGPWITTMNDPDAAHITLTINGEVRQSGSMAQLLWKTERIISYASSYLTLEPGDTILMGSPAGLATALPGDTVAVTIEGIGTLVNTVTTSH